MNTLELIAKIGADYIEKRVGTLSDDEGTSRFLLDGLLGDQVVALCEEILLRPTLNALCQIRVPRTLVEGLGLHEELMTDDKTTYWRNAPCDKPILILANTDDEQGQSLRDITAISSIELLAETDLWVRRASDGTGLTEDNRKWWGKALKALQVVKPLPLITFANYVLMTRQAVIEQGLPIIHALGWAFPSLQAPRDSSTFIGISSKHLGNVDKWKKIYGHILNDRAPYLKKITPKKQMIETEQLQAEWNKICAEIRHELGPIFEAFIIAPQKWTEESQALAELEWNADRVFALFEGLKQTPQTQPLGKSTIDLFEDKDLDLTEEDKDLLRRLDERKSKEANDDEVAFYESHRIQLLDNNRLKARWDKYVFGSPIECDDFCIGLLKATGRLFEQADNTVGKKLLRIEANKKSEKYWARDHSEDSLLYFVHRYRGLEALLGRKVLWDLKGLFDYEKLCKQEKERKGTNFRPNKSSSKAANQIKFNIYLIVGEGIEAEETSVQVIWTFNPSSVCMGFAEDWEKITKNPFCPNEVICETVSAKGQLQFIDLANVNTMMPVGGQSRGCLVRSCKKTNSIEKEWLDSLKASLESNFVNQEGYDILLSSWQNFSKTYKNALQEFWDVGLSSLSVLAIEKVYVELLSNLHKYALGDRNRHNLWVNVAKLGTVRVEGPTTAVIIPPWHPIRMLSMGVKAYQVAGLIRYLLDSNVVTFGDEKLFFSDLCYEIATPYYPEIAIGMHGTEPVTLIVSDYYADYTLMEPAIKGTETTSENPKEITKSIRAIVQRYIELQPHERANLSVVLYNSDSARLPEETVSSLSDMYEDEEEVRCQVVLRHRDKTKLASLYQTLIENADDHDSYVTSETYRDFMARLRIGILADDDKLQDVDGPPTDLVFLHNVIARLAKQNWQAETSSNTIANIFEHYPPRLSRRKPASQDEEKSIVYLACSIQPEFGWLYFKTLQCIMNGVDPVAGVNYLPTLEINFRNNETRDIFEEVHKLSQWVVNYDHLLERRQLRNQGVQIIRFQHAKYSGHNIVISSKAPLNLLDLMIIRRLRDVMAGIQITDQEFKDLAIRMREASNEISGDIVLRAAKRGKFVSELVGLVLSRFIIETELGKDKSIGWFLLDDYAQWFGQKEEHLADIMAISPSYCDGEPVLTIMISESKYIDSASVTQNAQVSARQLYETVERIQDALFGTTGRLDRDLWLSRIADMMIDGIEVPPGSDIKLADWRNIIRSGEVKILLKGYSHVFVHTQQPGELDPSRRTNIKSKMYCWQEVYGKERVQQLILSYKRKESPMNVRKAIDGTEPWSEGSPKRPSDSVKWASFATILHDEIETSGHESSESDTAFKDVAPPIVNATANSLSVANTAGTTTPAIPAEVSSDYTWAREPLRGVIDKLSHQVVPLREDDEWLGRTVTSLRNALIGYGMQANLIGKRLTPNAALAFFKGSDLLTEAGITAHRSKLLTVHALDIKNVIPEPGKIIVTVARPERQTISLLQLWKNRSLTAGQEQANLKLVIGAKEFNGETLYLEPAVKDAPHTLIAGTTGSGKSVLLQNLILDIACTNNTSQAQIYLIDPKLGLDYSVFKNLPHLTNGIVTDQALAANLLQSIVEEMHRRMALMAGKASNVIEYNKLVPEKQRIPIIWLIHDEFAAWMIDDNYKDLVSNVVQQLGMMARAAGIFLIFAAQRPEARVMTAQLRSNLDNRLILRVSSEADSEMALGEKGAEQLLGKGHLVARLPEESNLILAQVPFLTRQQAEDIVKALL
jgi:S-DNA-T family DNA segregation ATPase FtsK/SpoIIIE